MRFDLDSGTARPVEMPSGAFQTIVRDCHAAWTGVSGRPDIPRFADRPGEPASWSAPPQTDIYTLNWAPGAHLLVYTDTGYRLFGRDVDRVVAPEPFAALSLDGDVMSFVVLDDSGHQVLVLVDMTAA